MYFILRAITINMLITHILHELLHNMWWRRRSMLLRNWKETHDWIRQRSQRLHWSKMLL